MATQLSHYLSTHPGLEQSTGGASHLMHTDPAEGFFGRMSATKFAEAKGKILLGAQFNGTGYNATDETQTLASGTIAPAAGGLLWTTAASSTAVVSRGTRTVTPAAGQYWKAVMRVQSTTAATCGIYLGISAVTTTPFTNTTDMVSIFCPNNSAALTARVRGDSGTAADNTSFVTSNTGTTGAVSLTNTTDIELGIEFYFGATAAASWGRFWVNGYPTPFTSAQITQLFAILTTPVALTVHRAVQGDGSSRTATMQFFFAEVDR